MGDGTAANIPIRATLNDGSGYRAIALVIAAALFMLKAIEYSAVASVQIIFNMFR